MGKEEKEERSEAEIRETGSVSLDENRKNHRIKLLTIIGEIEGHEAVSGNTKATKYEHLLPMLAEIEDSEEVDGLLILLNTLGGDVEAGLSIAEMIASISIPCPGRKPFYRRPACGIGKVFFYCTKRNDGDPSGANQRDVHRCGTEPSEYDQNAG